MNVWDSLGSGTSLFVLWCRWMVLSSCLLFDFCKTIDSLVCVLFVRLALIFVCISELDIVTFENNHQ